MPANYICVTCGTQYPESENPPERCPICEDERQYVGHNGQQWTTLDALRANHRSRIEAHEPGLIGIGSEPKIAIGQRALLIQTPAGNVLWDCISLIDDETIRAVHDLGGISAIAISHPHFYSSMVEWAHAFDAPIYLHADNRPYVMRPDPSACYWEGETYPLLEGVTLIRCGGHFTGSAALHWSGGAEGRGVLLTGDTLMVVEDRQWVSFMYSFPNLIPLPAKTIRQITAALEPFEFDRIYSAWWEKVSAPGGKQIVARSAERYIRAVEGTLWT